MTFRLQRRRLHRQMMSRDSETLLYTGSRLSQVCLSEASASINTENEGYGIEQHAQPAIDCWEAPSACAWEA